MENYKINFQITAKSFDEQTIMFGNLPNKKQYFQSEPRHQVDSIDTLITQNKSPQVIHTINNFYISGQTNPRSINIDFD